MTPAGNQGQRWVRFRNMSAGAVQLCVRQGQCHVRGRNSLAQLWHRRLSRLLRSCKREGRKKGSGRFLEKSWNLFLTDLCNLISSCSPSASECTVRLRQGLEVAPTRCCERALMIQKCSSSSSGQQKIARLSMPETVRRAFMPVSDSSSETRWWGACHCNGHFFPQARCKDVGAPVRESGRSNMRQFALSTRACTDCVGHAIWAVDGIGAYDHVHRNAMLAKLHEVPSLQGLLPIPRVTFGKMRGATTHHPSRTGRIRRPSDANVVQFGDP